MNAKITIYEVKPNTYKVPAIDNRNRKGYAMFQMVADLVGTSGAVVEMVTVDGQRKQVEFTAFGWQVF